MEQLGIGLNPTASNSGNSRFDPRHVCALIDEAAPEAKRRDDVWRPIALRIAEWLPKARAPLRANDRIGEIKAGSMVEGGERGNSR